jgi:anti-anti-sigma factor
MQGEQFPTEDLPAGEVFGLRVEKNADRAWVSVGGELDVYAAPRLRSELDVVESESPELLVLDLRGLTFIDSSGLAVVLAAHQRAQQGGRRLAVLSAGSDAVESLFRTIRARDHLDVVEDPAELL